MFPFKERQSLAAPHSKLASDNPQVREEIWEGSRGIWEPAASRTPMLCGSGAEKDRVPKDAWGWGHRAFPVW